MRELLQLCLKEGDRGYHSTLVHICSVAKSSKAVEASGESHGLSQSPTISPGMEASRIIWSLNNPLLVQSFNESCIILQAHSIGLSHGSHNSPDTLFIESTKTITSHSGHNIEPRLPKVNGWTRLADPIELSPSVQRIYSPLPSAMNPSKFWSSLPCPLLGSSRSREPPEVRVVVAPTMLVSGESHGHSRGRI